MVDHHKEQEKKDREKWLRGLKLGFGLALTLLSLLLMGVRFNWW